MSVKVECAWARVFMRETKYICSLERDFGEGQSKYGARVLQERYHLYTEHFKNYNNLLITQSEFNRVVKVIDGRFGNWRNKKDKESYLCRFSPSNWNEEKVITKDCKKKHTLTACQTCRIFNSTYQCTFPEPKHNRKCNRGPLQEINKQVSSTIKKTATPKITKKKLKDIGQDIYSTINEQCKENYNRTLSQILTLVPEAGLEIKKSPEEKKRIVRDQQRKTKKCIENKLQENDAINHLSLRQSYSVRNEHRFANYFETKEEARERVKITPPNVKGRSHAPSIDNIEGNLTQLLVDAKSWDGQEINWTAKATEYGIKKKGSEEELKNKGQVLKTYLEANGIDTKKFKTANRRNITIDDEFKGMRVRRAMHKQTGGEVTIPVPKSNQKIKEEIKNIVENGKYNLGIPVGEREITKLRVSPEGEVEKKVQKISGRKIPFKDIREDALNSHSNLLRNNADTYYNNLSKDEVYAELKKINEETNNNEDVCKMRERLKTFQRKRHWLMWHDHSTLANHGFMLFCLRELYDPAIHFTEEEILIKTGMQIDVQATIEEPYIYILGPSSSTIESQMNFVPTRQEDLRDLANMIMTESGVPIKDTMRFMNGDNPATQFEDGHQHGGHYPCVGCDGNINSSYDLEYMLTRTYKTLDEKRKFIEAGSVGKTDALHPYKDLKVDQIREELKARGANYTGTKVDLQKDLAEILGGTVRKPALLHSGLSTKELQMENYEVLFFEALHCSMNHIKNILQEAPHHITDIDALISFKEILAVQLNKEKLRGVDYRKTLIFVTIAVYKHANRELKSLLLTLCEMIEIFYSQDHKRTPKMVLRLHNLCWKHAIQCRRFLTPTKSLTYRKLFGIYFHSCVAHSAFLLRMVSHRSTNAEMFERLFEKLSNITSKTWSKKIEDLAPNALLHAQVEKECKPTNVVEREEREITKLAKALPAKGNTVLPKTFLDKYAGDWNAHLKTIADFLQPGEGVWWREDDECIEFFDGPDVPSSRPEGPKLHHFRSTNIVKEKTFLDDCWGNIMTSGVKIPTTKLRIKGKWQTTSTCCPLKEDTEEQDTEMTGQQSDEGNLLDVTALDDEDHVEYFQDTDMELQLNDDDETEELQEDDQSQELPDEHECHSSDFPLTSATHATTSDTNCTPQHSIGVKRPHQDQCAQSTDEPSSKKQKESNTELISKTAKALERVLGRCSEVENFDKIKQALTTNPTSRYNQDKYRTALAHVQVKTLKAYRQLNDELKERKDKTNTHHGNKDKQLKIAAELLKSWKITVHRV